MCRVVLGPEAWVRKVWDGKGRTDSACARPPCVKDEPGSRQEVWLGDGVLSVSIAYLTTAE